MEMRQHDTSNQELIARWAKDRCEDSFRELVSRHANLVFSAANRTSGDAQIASDALQLTFISLARKAPALLSHPALLGWLQVCAVQHARNLMRKRDREARKIQALEAHMSFQEKEESGGDWNRVSPLLDDAMRRLSTADREIILLRYYSARSIKELAGHLDIAVDAATKRLARATAKLKKILQAKNCHIRGEFWAVIALGLSGTPSLSAATICAVSANSIAAAGVGSASFFSKILLTFYLMKKTSIAAILLVIAGLVTVAVVSQRNASAKATSELSQQADFRITKNKSSVSDTAGEKLAGTRNAQRSAEREDALKKEYGDPRMDLARNVGSKLMKIFADVMEMEESILLNGQPPKTDDRAAQNLPGFSEVTLNDEQKAKIPSMLFAAMQRAAAEHQKTAEALKSDPTKLMEYLLAEDAAARKTLSSAEATERQKALNLPIEQLFDAMDLSKGTVEQAQRDPQFRKELAETLDRDQYEKWAQAKSEALNDAIKEDKKTSLEEMESMSSTMQTFISGMKQIIKSQQIQDEK